MISIKNTPAEKWFNIIMPFISYKLAINYGTNSVDYGPDYIEFKDGNDTIRIKFENKTPKL